VNGGASKKPETTADNRESNQEKERTGVPLSAYFGFAPLHFYSFLFLREFLGK
jgi:hypothetical protein